MPLERQTVEDANLREIALEKAIQSLGVVDSSSAVLYRAQKFYKFLKGDYHERTKITNG